VYFSFFYFCYHLLWIKMYIYYIHRTDKNSCDTQCPCHSKIRSNRSRRITTAYKVQPDQDISVLGCFDRSANACKLSLRCGGVASGDTFESQFIAYTFVRLSTVSSDCNSSRDATQPPSVGPHISPAYRLSDLYPNCAETSHRPMFYAHVS